MPAKTKAPAPGGEPAAVLDVATLIVLNDPLLTNEEAVLRNLAAAEQQPES